MSGNKWVIDRFEGDQAILVSENFHLVVNRKQLPVDAVEGAVLDDDLILDLAETEKSRERVRAKIEELLKFHGNR